MSFISKSISRKFLSYYLVLVILLTAAFGIFYYFKIPFDLSIVHFGIILGAFILVTLILFFFQISRPLRIVMEQVQSLLSGKPYKNIYTNRTDEIGILAYFFNKVTKGFGEVKGDIEERDRMSSELSIASDLQRDILPLENPFVEGLHIIAKTKPATELGGDSFNFLTVKNKTYIYIGDVTGHGVAAGLIMTMVHSLINVYANFCVSAYDILVNVNRDIKKHVKKSMFMTMAMLSWDHTTKKMSYVGAGHEHILVYRADSGICDVVLTGGVALGMVPDNSKVISEKELDLNDGDLVVLYSDGIIEARNPSGELFGLDRLKALVIEYAPQYSADGINYHVAKDTVAFMAGATQLDDMTLIVIKIDKNVTSEAKVQDRSINWVENENQPI